MPRRYYEREEDWMVTCPECHGRGTIGTGDSRKRCPKCGIENEVTIGQIKRERQFNAVLAPQKSI